ncbi:hypothetical protein CLOM_g19677 [Closterium sp. NIES-68]|nr:hypothetical protein CLOM_g19677 [Closterium sp. NIES-68]GJP63931.1 hypothetical protein CLOP_g20960 [Closterium sp. NIES-67]
MSPSEAEWRLMLTEIGVQPRKMSRILTQYHAMPADVAMERLIFLQSLGVDTGKALSSFPKLLFYPPSIARAMADYLTSIGVQPGLIGKVLSACPQLLGLSIENNICPTISHLVEAWGLDQSRDIPVVISRHPRCLTYSISENLQPTLAFWLGSGITKPAKLIRANPSILGLSITKRILPTIAAFDSYGIPPHHTINMLQRFPHLFNYSWNDNLMPKLQYLEEVGRGIDEAVQYPQYFGYSLVRRIRPRLGGVARAGLHVSLSFVLRLKDEDFERLYGDVCAEEGGGRGDTREGHEQESCLREAS